jgi:metallo-beta-lactamase family protein
MSLALTFHGAAGTVTGSCTLVEAGDHRILVDCGLFQGPKSLKELNYRPFPFDPSRIGAVVLTHAHVDHSGLLPKLRVAGFRGRIIATDGTRDLLRWLLPDAGAIQEADVERLNRRNERRGRAGLAPIYTRADGEETAEAIEAVPMETWVDVVPGVRARWWRAGHILGAASIELEVAMDGGHRYRLLFSGDLGPPGQSFLAPPDGPSGLDALVVEATYGDRTRPALDPAARREVLRSEIVAGLAAGGNIVIPAFAVERTQELVDDLVRLGADGSLPPHRIFIDSPLAARITEVFARHAAELENGGDGKARFADPRVRITVTPEESMGLARIASGAILISASGMCDAGRVRHHLRNNLWRPESTVLLVGYQAPGTLGRLLADGTSTVRMQGEIVRVKARIRTIDVYSGHADRVALGAWVKARLPVSGPVFVIHGEPDALATFAGDLAALGLARRQVRVPGLDQRAELGPHGRCRLYPAAGVPRLDREARRAASEGWDWHNDYAAFLVELQERLAGTADARQQAALLRRLRRALARPEDA